MRPHKGLYKYMNERKLGWLPDLPDHRDHTAMLSKVGTRPSKVSLERNFFSPIENQGSLGSCTANAAAGIVEYCEKKATSRHVDISRLFLYKVTRKLMGVTGDTGAYLRDTIKALRMIGAPPEKHYPYVIANFDKEPDAFAYSLASNYKSLSYFRVDAPGLSNRDILSSMKDKLSINMPLMFGFTCFSSIYSASADKGFIPYPSPGEDTVGGHAVTAVGYDDATGLIEIRNSWGTGWGQSGYGFLPYDYVLNGLVNDIWGITQQSWVDLGIFN